MRFEQPRLQHLNIGASLARRPGQLRLRTEPHGIFLGKVDARVWICSKSKDRSPTELVYGMLRGRLDIEHQVDESVHTQHVCRIVPPIPSAHLETSVLVVYIVCIILPEFHVQAKNTNATMLQSIGRHFLAHSVLKLCRHHFTKRLFGGEHLKELVKSKPKIIS